MVAVCEEEEEADFSFFSWITKGMVDSFVVRILIEASKRGLEIVELVVENRVDGDEERGDQCFKIQWAARVWIRVLKGWVWDSASDWDADADADADADSDEEVMSLCLLAAKT